eukprot:CAMPEP_0204211014 /NCGR_PEP_ID=MMETSP0361-20130328/74333_1 /ASSEMBLY_ACC=CAM_ASM_000343 /TAXON_ID=268821 /ORGANISM="Scrippsiella Hangoei, Strain SHTV-5" /LENGTH=52 /DNA_ID=CAMNT_0051175227 /DNA_START=307 /DNA_END=462 /DNA_ORIENTATION=+
MPSEGPVAATGRQRDNSPRTLAAQPPQRPKRQGQATAAGFTHGDDEFCKDLS